MPERSLKTAERPGAAALSVGWFFWRSRALRALSSSPSPYDDGCRDQMNGDPNRSQTSGSVRAAGTRRPCVPQTDTLVPVVS